MMRSIKEVPKPKEQVLRVWICVICMDAYYCKGLCLCGGKLFESTRTLAAALLTGLDTEDRTLDTEEEEMKSTPLRSSPYSIERYWLPGKSRYNYCVLHTKTGTVGSYGTPEEAFDALEDFRRAYEKAQVG